MIGNKRQRKESEVAETKVVAADEGDEGEANGDSGGDSQGGDRQNRMDGDRQRDGPDGNSRPIRRQRCTQRLGGGGKPGILM
jgi:hypothetical protein